MYVAHSKVGTMWACREGEVSQSITDLRASFRNALFIAFSSEPSATPNVRHGSKSVRPGCNRKVNQVNSSGPHHPRCQPSNNKFRSKLTNVLNEEVLRGKRQAVLRLSKSYSRVNPRRGRLNLPICKLPAYSRFKAIIPHKPIKKE